MERARGEGADACEALRAELRARDEEACAADEEAHGLRREAGELRALLEEAAGEVCTLSVSPVPYGFRVFFLSSLLLSSLELSDTQSL